MPSSSEPPTSAAQLAPEAEARIAAVPETIGEAPAPVASPGGQAAPTSGPSIALQIPAKVVAFGVELVSDSFASYRGVPTWKITPEESKTVADPTAAFINYLLAEYGDLLPQWVKDALTGGDPRIWMAAMLGAEMFKAWRGLIMAKLEKEAAYVKEHNLTLQKGAGL